MGSGTLFVLAVPFELWCIGPLCRECDSKGFDETSEAGTPQADTAGAHGSWTSRHRKLHTL